MADDPKTAAHRLLQEQRDTLSFLLRVCPLTSESRGLIECVVAICDVLELQIRRIDELEKL